MRVVVTGAGGLAGKEVLAVLAKAGHEVIPKTHKDLDITDAEGLKRLFAQSMPEWVINLAAYTNVDACEDHEEIAYSINAKAPGIMARLCRERGIRLCHISTDYVFDGKKASPYTEDDIPNPLSVYGKSKLYGEREIERNLGQYLIIRTQWLFGPGGANFVENIINLAREKDVLEVVDDQRGCPTYSRDLASALLVLIEMGATGIYNVSCSGDTTWFGLAKKAIEYAGLDTRVIPVDSKRFPRPATRPKNSVLSKDKFTRLTGRKLPSWEDSLRQYIEDFLIRDV